MRTHCSERNKQSAKVIPVSLSKLTAFYMCAHTHHDTVRRTTIEFAKARKSQSFYWGGRRSFSISITRNEKRVFEDDRQKIGAHRMCGKEKKTRGSERAYSSTLTSLFEPAISAYCSRVLFAGRLITGIVFFRRRRSEARRVGVVVSNYSAHLDL